MKSIQLFFLFFLRSGSSTHQHRLRISPLQLQMEVNLLEVWTRITWEASNFGLLGHPDDLLAPR